VLAIPKNPTQSHKNTTLNPFFRTQKAKNPTLTPFFRAQKAWKNEQILKSRQVKPTSEQKKDIGSSNCFNLHTAFTNKLYKNGEAITFASEFGYKISGKNEDGSNNQGRKSGTILEQGNISSHGKRCLRIVSSEYNRMIHDKELSKRKGYRAYCSFQSLTFRRIGPRDHVQAKDIFRNYMQRWYQVKGEEFHNAWVAENQQGKVLSNAKKSYRLIRRLPMIHFHVLSPEFIDMNWQTKNWNECVAYSFLKQGQIDRLEYQQWMNEVDTWLAWRVRIANYAEQVKAGTRKRGRPKSPGIGEFMLTPNVRAVWNAGRYMSKYLSKQGSDLKGHLWNISRKSRELTVPVITKKKFRYIYPAGELVKVVQKAVRYSGGFSFGWTDYNSNPGFWTPNGEKALSAYFEIMEQYDINPYTAAFTVKKPPPSPPPGWWPPPPAGGVPVRALQVAEKM